MIKIHGIPNCDTMKKARKWLDAHNLDYQFHNFKKEGLDNTTLRHWINLAGWEILLNRRGMMWRKLSVHAKAGINETSAIEIMLETPSIIKRPVLEVDGNLYVGFSEERYGELFG
ncbi:MAG: ArsC family reductase [Sedimenticolaceae bacterium]